MQTNPLDSKYETFARAMFLKDLPCNSRPCITKWDEYVAEGGDPQSDTAKAIGWTILTIITGVQVADVRIKEVPESWNAQARMSWPDTERIDMYSEWSRLNEAFNPKTK